MTQTDPEAGAVGWAFILGLGFGLLLGTTIGISLAENRWEHRATTIDETHQWVVNPVTGKTVLIKKEEPPQ